jgi:Shugoshin C terminus
MCSRVTSIKLMLTYYRRQEILNLVAEAEADTTDSPEIGPPPISQFVDEDPVKIDLPKRTPRDENEELSGLDPALSINLEQRRKRKDSTGLSESRRASTVEVSHGVREAAGSLKAGAKRKLSVRDDDEPTLPVPPSSPDGFKYTKVASEDKGKNKVQPQTEKPAGRITRELAVARGAPREKSATTATARKVLAPKSVNNSPKKGTKSLILEDMKSVKDEMAKPNPVKERSRGSRPDLVHIQTSIEPIKSVEIQQEPETPAAPDIFSPSSSQPSTVRESRDTPPPPDLGPGTEGQRPSRRTRPAVSYAEPNLRDKMRRPTKELIDAVSKDEKAHRGSSVKLEEEVPSITAAIKAEPEADDEWKRMPAASSATVENSPLSSKAPVSDTLPSSITTHRKRRESILSQAEADLSKTSSGSAIAALLAENRRAKAAAREKAKENEATNEKTKEGGATVRKAMSKLDIYEFRCSSPNPEDAQPKTAKEEKVTSRVSRRLSSAPRDGAAQSESEASDMEGTRKAEGSTSRRRQSTLGLRISSSTAESGKESETEKTLRRANSTTGIADAASRTDRISARRRSMML